MQKSAEKGRKKTFFGALFVIFQSADGTLDPQMSRIKVKTGYVQTDAEDGDGACGG